jgi:hypothetical protein
MWRTTRTCGREPLFCGADCGTRRMSKFLRRSPCVASEPGHRTLPPSHQREGRKAGSQRVRGSGRNEDPHRDLGRGIGPVTGSVGSERPSGRGGRHLSASSRGPLGAHTTRRPSPTPVDQRLAVARPGPSWMEDPHRDSGCGVGPVTGAAGSDRQCGRGGRHRFRLKAEGLLMLIPSRGPHPFQRTRCRLRPPGATRRARRLTLFTCPTHP